ncbi:hypothetical protein AXF42_Ash006961 [Apostasia shenzhenica]|uniref:Uncharacterized protein n=1 Tax=Apostasia shenzhenica TaxID=1088818 RepID=A0A2I0BER3_9ASPA|nr:hypothetical protein AXF42_Ash006961 [Apostasia shenzhenica]
MRVSLRRSLQKGKRAYCARWISFINFSPTSSLSSSLMAASSTVLSLAVYPETFGAHSNKLKAAGRSKSLLAIQQSSKRSHCLKNLSVCAQYGDHSKGGGGDFVAGFLLGGAVFGTLAYIFAPQIRRSILNEDESGFQKVRRPIYYDDGLERTRQTLNAKLSQLNSAIDNISSRLRGGTNVPADEPFETDPEMEATLSIDTMDLQSTNDS